MSCPCQFEPKIQVSCAVELVNIIRAGDLVAKRGEVLEHVGCIVGGIGAMQKGSEDDETPVVFGDLPDTVDGVCTAIKAETDQIVLQPADVQPFGISPLLAALIKRLIKMLLDELL